MMSVAANTPVIAAWTHLARSSLPQGQRMRRHEQGWEDLPASMRNQAGHALQQGLEEARVIDRLLSMREEAFADV